MFDHFPTYHTPQAVPHINMNAADAKAERASAERAELKASDGWCDPLDHFDPLGSARGGAGRANDGYSNGAGRMDLDPLAVSPGAGIARLPKRAAGEENDPLATRSPPPKSKSKGTGVVVGTWDDLLM